METVRIRDPGWKKVGSGIRDKHPGSATLALRSGRLKVGEAEYPTTMNQTRSHMTGEEGCTGSCKTPVVAPERKIIQVLMEVLVEEDWVWWNE